MGIRWNLARVVAFMCLMMLLSSCQYLPGQTPSKEPEQIADPPPIPTPPSEMEADASYPSLQHTEPWQETYTQARQYALERDLLLPDNRKHSLQDAWIEAPVSRKTFAVWLAKSQALKPVSSEESLPLFEDVSLRDSDRTWIEAVAEKGWMSGFKQHENKQIETESKQEPLRVFKASETIQRQNLIYLYTQVEKPETTVSASIVERLPALDMFKDSDDMDETLKEKLSWAYYTGLLETIFGVTPPTEPENPSYLYPQSPVTQGEALISIYLLSGG